MLVMMVRMMMVMEFPGLHSFGGLWAPEKSSNKKDQEKKKKSLSEPSCLDAFFTLLSVSRWTKEREHFLSQSRSQTQLKRTSEELVGYAATCPTFCHHHLLSLQTHSQYKFRVRKWKWTKTGFTFSFFHLCVYFFYFILLSSLPTHSLLILSCNTRLPLTKRDSLLF